MSAPTVASTEPHLPDEKPVAQYRSISLAAVVAGGLGLASAVVLLSPILVPLAIAAIVTAVIALRRIAASGGQLVGRGTAVAGLCLATLFAAWGTARYFSRQTELETHARRTVDVWLALMQEGKLREAYQFRQPAAARISSPEAMAEHYVKNDEAAQELKVFRDDILTKELHSQGAAAEVRFESATASPRYGLSDQLVLKYSYQRPASEGGGRQPVWIFVKRQIDQATQRPDWEITATQLFPPRNQQE
jgi:hypothetical protein